MKQVAVIEENSLIDYANSYNELMNELSRTEVEKVENVSPTSALVYYDTPDEVEKSIEAAFDPDYRVEIPSERETEYEAIVIEVRVPKENGRVCAECENYIWGKSCPYHEGHVRHMDSACPMFNLNISRF